MISCELISSKREGWGESKSEEDKYQTKDFCLSLFAALNKPGLSGIEIQISM